MEPEGSLPHSQVPAICPYPEPAGSSPCSNIPFPVDPSEYYPPIYALVSQVVSFPQVSPTKPFIRLSSPPYVLYKQIHHIPKSVLVVTGNPFRSL